jgi:hypothetical protein
MQPPHHESGNVEIPPRLTAAWARSGSDVPPVPSLRCMRLTPVAAVLLAALMTAGCGGRTSGDSGAADKKDREAAAAQEAAKAKKLADARAAKLAVYNKCVAATKPLRDSLAQIDSRLDVGLSYDDYGDRLGDVQVAYDATVPQLDTAGEQCLGVAIPLENALNAYNKVLNAWGECIDDYNCDFSEGETNDKAQAGWAKAGQALKNSDRKLAALRPTG